MVGHHRRQASPLGEFGDNTLEFLGVMQNFEQFESPLNT